MMAKNIYKQFDYLGVMAFAYLTGDAIVDLAAGETGPRVVLRLMIVLGGLLVDGYLVFFHRDNSGA